MSIRVPESEAKLYDLLQEKFGLGDWGPDSTEPWYVARNRETSKLRSMMRRRRMTREDVAVAAWYAERQHLPIAALWQVLDLVTEAKKAYRERDEPNADAREELLAAALQAHQAGEHDWAERLYAADPRQAADVLSAWRNR